MNDFKQKSKSDISAKMSLYSILSIITIIVICAAVWNLLDLAKNTYLNTFKGKVNNSTKQKIAVSKTKPQNLLLRKLFVGFYLAKAKIDNIRYQAILKENETKAAKLLKKYAQAQQIYKDHYGYYAEEASTLIIEENGKYTIIDPKLKVLNASDNKANPTDGYFFIEIVKEGLKDLPGSFFLSAIPAKYGISGINTYCINEQAQIKKMNTGGRPEFDIKIINCVWKDL